MVPPSDNLHAQGRGFSMVLAHRLAHMAKLAYMSQQEVRDDLALYDSFQDLQFIDRDGTQCFVAEFETYAVLAFRGTERDYRDILTDLDFRQAPVPDLGGKVHAGFLRAFKTVYEPVRAALPKLGKPIYITGHSLGGALALIAASALGINMSEIRAVYSFGCPRVGDKAFNENLKHYTGVRHFRFTNTADIVPWVPLMALQYRHGGHHVHLTADGRWLPDPGLWRQFRSVAAAMVPGLLKARNWRGLLPSRVFTDHRMTNYQAKLEGLRHG